MYTNVLGSPDGAKSLHGDINSSLPCGKQQVSGKEHLGALCFHLLAILGIAPSLTERLSFCPLDIYPWNTGI